MESQHGIWKRTISGEHLWSKFNATGKHQPDTLGQRRIQMNIKCVLSCWVPPDSFKKKKDEKEE